jgi:hypothetical protein
MALVAVGPLPFLAVGGWDGAGLAIGLGYAAQFAPAARSAVRSANPVGLSPATWWMALAEAAIWLIYGFTRLDPALIVGGAGGTICAAAIVVRLWSLAPTPHPADPTDPVARPVVSA